MLRRCAQRLLLAAAEAQNATHLPAISIAEAVPTTSSTCVLSQRPRGLLMQRGFAAAAKPSLAQIAEQALNGIVVDTSAVQRLKELQAETPNKPVYLRVEVEGGGCSGFQYKFRLDDTTNEDDRVFERDGAKVVTDEVSLEYLKGAKLEFEDTLMRSGFLIAANPNSESSCGCGSSFTAKSKKK